MAVGDPRGLGCVPFPAMRITGGRARGIQLRIPKGDKVRPAMDRLRQAVFSSLGGAVEGVRFVDLFAGSGSYGLEALSRGAAGGVFVEQDRKALQCLRENLEAVCKSAGRGLETLEVAPADAFHWQPIGGPSASIIFADPPFRIVETNTPRLFERFNLALAPGPAGRVVFEMPAELELTQPGWTLLKRLGGGAAGSAVACIYSKDI